jgi:hypothetical protein
MAMVLFDPHNPSAALHMCVQVPTMFMSGFLLMRALLLAAANLTVNEWMNRYRYVHLHYTGAGFSNRFDRGVAANCYDFWCGPKLQDYWGIWETGEQVSERSSAACKACARGAATALSTWKTVADFPSTMPSREASCSQQCFVGLW